MTASALTLRGGSYHYDRGCSCGADPSLVNCHPGRFPKCGGCGKTLLFLGKVPDAPCVTPNGRIDGHGAYVRFVGGKTICDFCKKPLEVSI